MKSDVTALSGRCHCGNIELVFETELPIDRLPLRACACSFCSSHGARCTSDPQGRVRITIQDTDRLSRYQFGLKAADFLVCKTCGVYVGALLTEDDSAWATVNVNAFEPSDGLGRNPVTVTYDAETEEERRARRKKAWTPAVLEFRAFAP
ncbi:aldehyde-activating protein [Rhodospirillaceae bacterium SYSU D60014]|uniref:GFA family protein n=1 Tax=Virgifigura deserti TaxID=2268457 RepID=UPI000E673E3F